MTQNARFEEKIKEDKARMVIARSWKDRIKSLKTRKENRINEEKFCEKHGISPTRFNRNKNLVSTPTWKKIGQVEAAFATEGANPPKNVGHLLQEYRHRML